jgi:DNA-binding protein H-NS
MKTEKIATRSAALLAIAKGTPRPEIERSLKKIRQELAKAREKYTDAQKRLDAAQAEVNKYQALMSEARNTLTELNEHIKIMDLSGASGVKEKNGENFYIVDGGEYHVDCSDVNDVKMTKKKEFLRSKPDTNEDEDGFTSDISFDDDFANSIVASASKRYK